MQFPLPPRNGVLRLLPLPPIPIHVQRIASKAIIGQDVTIPITLTGTRRLAELGITTGTATVSYNASLLQPIDGTPRGAVSEGIRRIPLVFPFSTTSDTTTILLRFKATLGNDTATTLRLDTLRVVDGVTIQQTSSSGTFTLQGFNNAGGTPALFVSQKAPTTLVVKPNPFLHNVSIQFDVRHAAHVELVVFAADGKRVATLHKGFHAAGQHEYSWNALTDAGGRLSAGVYTVRLFADGQPAAEAQMLHVR